MHQTRTRQDRRLRGIPTTVLAAAIILSTTFVGTAFAEPMPQSAVAEEKATTSKKSLDMLEHQAWATNARDALTGGDLPLFHEEVQVMLDLVNHAEPPAGRDTHYEAMRRAIEKATASTDIATAAKATGDLAKSCGSCHAEGDGPTFAPGGAEGTGDGEIEHMRRHQWALDQLWNGIAGPSKRSWKKGAQALKELPLHSERWEQLPAIERAKIDAWTEGVHELGARAVRLETQEARAQLLGYILETCGSCHQLLRTGGPLDSN